MRNILVSFGDCFPGSQRSEVSGLRVVPYVLEQHRCMSSADVSAYTAHGELDVRLVNSDTVRRSP